jgi:signal transduction histidine kinase
MEDPLLLFCPYPTVQADGSLLDGTIVPQSNYCREKCSARECLTFSPGEKRGVPVFYTCTKGFSVAVVTQGESLIRINGVLEASTNMAPKRFKKEQRNRKLKPPELARWLKAFAAVQPEYKRQVDARAEDAVHALHDIKSLIGSVLHTAEQYIFEQSGQTIEEKIEASSPHLQTIYHSCEILQSLLQITDILTNPAVAQFGTPLPISAHGAILKLVKIHENRALSQRKRLTLRGRSVNKVRLYSSFILIPHILIDNAIKHADRDTEIRIWIEDKESGEIKLNFSSFGLLVPERERDAIFLRGVRGSNVRAKGSGLGLYIAQIVARANGFQLSYRAKPTGILGNNKGYSHFLFTIPVAAPRAPHQPVINTLPLSTRSAYG